MQANPAARYSFHPMGIRHCKDNDFRKIRQLLESQKMTHLAQYGIIDAHCIDILIILDVYFNVVINSRAEA